MRDILPGVRGATATAVVMGDLTALAAPVGVDLDAPFDVGDGTPPVGDPDAPLGIDGEAARVLGAWWTFTTAVLDEVVGGRGTGAAPSVIRLWPEHFDAACDLAWGPGDGQRVNIGGAPGDADDPAPYLYVGP